MKHLKTFLAAIVILVSAFTFAACGANTNNGNNADSENNGSVIESGGSQSGSSSGSNSGNSSDGDKSEGTESGKEIQTPSEGEENGNGQDAPDKAEGKILVVYFSCTNNTKTVAQKIQAATHSAIYEIVPAIPYTSADIHYQTSNCRANLEQNNPSARPEISGDVENISEYETILIGYPIWHNDAPKIIYTFLDSYNLAGKKLIPFCTHGGSGINGSENKLKSYKPDLNWVGGRGFSSSVSQSEVNSWVNTLGL